VLVDHDGEQVIATRQPGLGAARLVGDDVVWTTFGGVPPDSGVFRAPASGGTPTKVWERDVRSLLVNGRDVYVAGTSGVGWIDLQASRTTVLATNSAGSLLQSLTIHGDRLYWADEGQSRPGDEPSGRVRSVPLHGGDVITQASKVPSPEVIAVDESRIYYGTRNKDGVSAVPIGGGNATTVLPSDGARCATLLWMRRTPRGLLVARGRLASLIEVRFVPLADK
jgi:hypothetical protein